MEGVLKLTTKVAAVTAIALAAVSLSACSSSSSGDASEKVGSLTLWHNSADSPAQLQVYKGFTKKTGIKLNLVSIPSDSFETTTQTKWATGDRPDVLEYHATRSLLLPLNPQKNMQDLSSLPYVKKSGDLYKSSGSVDGKVYAAITNFPSIFGLYYNKALLQKAGIDSPPSSFADLTSACTALQKIGVTPIYESGASGWPTQVLSLMYVADSNDGDAYGTAVAENKKKLTAANGPFMKALDAYKSLEDAGCFNKDYSTGTFEKAVTSVTDGQAAMAAFQSDFYTQFLAAANNDGTKLAQEVGWTPVSSERAVGTYAPTPIGTFYAPKTNNQAKEAAARKFIEFTTGDGYASFLKQSQQVPVISGFDSPSGLNSLQQSYQDAYKTSTLAFNSNIPGFGAFATETGKLLNGQSTPDQAAENMQAAVQQAATAAGLAGW